MLSRFVLYIFNFLRRALRMLGPSPQVNVLKCTVCELSRSELLTGKVALITGATSGIGFAIAQAFLSAGASVVITGRDAVKLHKAVENLTPFAHGSGWIRGVAWDVSEVNSFATRLLEVLRIVHSQGSPGIDILVNNAGVLGGSIGRTSEMEYDDVMNINLKGAFFMSRCIGTYMKQNGIRGNILNIASSSSLRPAISAYSLSKWGIRGLTVGLAKVLIKDGIVVNGIAPGPTVTPMLKDDTDDDLLLPNNPSGRWIHPSEIANMAVMLVSDAGRMIVGDILYMTGGAGIITQDDIVYNFD